MAWTTPAAPGASVLVTNSFWTTQIVNNLNECGPAKVTTKGDLTPATGANALTRLAVGSNGAVLVADTAATAGVRWSSTGKTASGAIAVNVDISNTLTASANGDSLIQERIIGTFAKATASNLDVYGLLIDQTNAASSGTGAINNGYALYITPHTIAASNWGIYVSGGRGRLGDGPIYIGDTTNANMTAGLTINGINSDEQLSLKLSGFAHGVTGATETDTYFHAGALNSTKGGVLISGYESFATTFQAVVLRGVQTVVDSTRSTAALGAIDLRGALKNGTAASNMSANSNILVVTDNQIARFIFDSDGDLSADAAISASAYDAYDDAALCRALDVAISDPSTIIEDRFKDWMQYGREDLERAKLVTFNADGHHFVNYTKLSRLHTGAIWQQETKVRQLGAEIQELREQLAQSKNLIAAISRRLLDKGD